MRLWARVTCAVAFLVGGCRGTTVDRVPVDVVLPSAPDCRDAIVGTITLTALGDFPATSAAVARLDATGAPLDPVTGFPFSTLAFSVSGHASRGDAFGWAMRGSLGEDSTLALRPVGRSCPIADSEARLPNGAAVAVVDDARVVLVGGLDEGGEATRRVAILAPRSETVALPRMDGAVDTAFATVTALPGEDAVLVAGGAVREGGDAQLTWERIPLDGGALTTGTLRQRRRDHAAIAIDAGAAHGVLLVGGSDGAAALGSIEWVDPATRAGDLLDATTLPRVGPSVVALDPEHVAVVGGRDAAGRTVTEIDVIDVAHDTRETLPIAITPLAVTDVRANEAGDWLTVLPSGTVAWSAGHTGARTLRVAFLRERRVEEGGPLPDVFHPVASALPSGRILLEGHLGDGTRVGYVVDPGSGATSRVDVSRVPSALVALADGTTLELAPAGASSRLDEPVTPLDGQPISIALPAQRASLALDLGARWTELASGLAPVVDGARADVPVLRFARFEATFDASGAYDVLLTGERGETLATIAVAAATIGIGACTAPRTADRVRIVLDAGGLSLGSDGSARVTCPGAPHARVGIAVVARDGAVLRSLAIARLP